MNRLQSELQRLYLVASAGLPPAMTGPRGEVRALVMEVIRPASWEVLSRVWRGVQAELQFPAPAIAVSGSDGLQLWFSLDAPIAAEQAASFLESLRAHFLPKVDPMRVRLMPAADGSTHARTVPAVQASGDWSAFVAPDLAPVFADTPWLDTPPGEDNQAGLLGGLASVMGQDFDAAKTRLALLATPAATVVAARPSDLGRPAGAPSAPGADPRLFLTRVMQDETVPMALRIEAAKALLD